MLQYSSRPYLFFSMLQKFQARFIKTLDLNKLLMPITTGTKIKMIMQMEEVNQNECFSFLFM